MVGDPSKTPIAEPNINNSFVENWILSKDRLIRMELGTMTASHWTEAAGLLESLRSHQSLRQSQQRLEDAFAMTDRLCLEIKTKNKTNNTLSYPLNHFSLMALLAAWQDWIISSIPQQTASQKEKRAKTPWRTETSIAQGRLTTAAVLESVKRYLDSGCCRPDPMAYNIVLHVMKKVDNPRKSPTVAHKIFLNMLEQSNHNPFDTSRHPNVFTVNEILEIWAQSWLSEAPRMADEYLRLLKVWFHRTNLPGFQPLPNTYCSVMDAHSRSSDPSLAFDRIQSLFLEMQKDSRDGVLDQKSYTRVCQAFATCRQPDAARAILDRMLSHGCKPDLYTFSVVMTAYGRARRPQDAQDLFQFLEADLSLCPNKAIYDALIWAHAIAGDPHQAEAVFARLVAGRAGDLELDERTWTGVLTAWAESADPDAPRQIQSILQRLEQMSAEKKLHGGLTVSSYNPWLRWYARQSNTGAAREAQRLFQWLEQHNDPNLHPDQDSLLNLITAWGNAGDVVRCETVLRDFCGKMEQRGETLVLDREIFNVVIAAWARSKHLQAGEKAVAWLESMRDFGVQPDIVSYNSALWALARSETFDPAEKLERLFRKMQKQWNEGDTSAKPNNITFNAVIYGLVRSSSLDLLNRAETIFREMSNMGAKPDNKTYNTLMAAWMRQNRPERTEQLFQEMMKGFESGDTSLIPHFEAHVTRLQAWSKSGNPEMAARVIQEWVSICEQKPTTKHFNMVLQGWLRSRHPEAALKAEAGIRQMFDLASSKQFDCRPNVISFTTVISALARSDLPNAGDRAFDLLQELENLAGQDESLQPNWITYSQVLLALFRSGDGGGRIRKILHKLRKQNVSFWQGETSTRTLLGKVERALEQSPLCTDRDVVAELRVVKSMATEAWAKSHHSGARKNGSVKKLDEGKVEQWRRL